MAIINIPDQARTIEGLDAIKAYLNDRGIAYAQWRASAPLPDAADQETILAAYADELRPLIEQQGYTTADVISVDGNTPNLDAIRAKFLSEHTHSEDEVRYFVDGEGLFWFNLGGREPIFSVLCQAGDFISVPKMTRHWFDLGADPFVRAIRIFIDPSGWVPEYTDSGIDKRYNPNYCEADLD